MLKQNRNFRENLNKVLRQQFSVKVGFLYELEQDLVYIVQWEEKEKKGEIDEIDLKEFLDIMVRKTTGVVDGIEALNVLAKFNIEGYEEENNEGRKVEDTKLEENIL